MKFKKNQTIVFIIIILALAGAVILKRTHIVSPAAAPPPSAYTPTKPDIVAVDKVLLNVPFTSQAPTGNWSDPREEDGCEEASLLMAWSWINETALTPTVAEKAIQDMSDFETAHYGNYLDLDAEDTAQLMKDYYHYNKVSVKSDISLNDIKTELRKGNLVLVPANGQKLDNPHYKSPGPLTHMLVVRGFDNSKHQITTNDSGTRYGEGYIYNEQVFFNALVNYPSGNHEDQTGRPKAMIVVEK